MKYLTGISQGFDKCTKATLQNNYFWGPSPDDCFCLEIWSQYHYNKKSLLNCVPCVLKVYSRANVPCVLMWSRVKMPCVLTCSRAYMLCMLTCSCANVPCVLTCSRAHVPTCLACLRAHVPCGDKRNPQHQIVSNLIASQIIKNYTLNLLIFFLFYSLDIIQLQIISHYVIS